MLEFQNTIKNQVSISGIGLHTGELVKMTLSPTQSMTGITFFLNSPNAKKIIKYNVNTICNTTLATTIGVESANLSTIEHLMAVLHVLDIHNVDISVEGTEIPILDGSALQFYYLIKSAGKKSLNFPKTYININREFEIKNGTSYFKYIPMDSGLHIKCNVEFGSNKSELECNIDEDTFRDIIASSKTFCFLKDVEKLKSLGYIKGGSLDNAIVYDENYVEINPDYVSSPAAHKIIDFLGDIFCIGPIKGNILIQNPTHTFNLEISKYIYKYFMKGKLCDY